MRTITGIVVSDKMKQTIVVKVDHYVTHAKYKKSYRVSKKYKVHDENNTHKIGENVTFYETRPISKTKCWTVTPPTAK